MTPTGPQRSARRHLSKATDSIDPPPPVVDQTTLDIALLDDDSGTTQRMTLTVAIDLASGLRWWWLTPATPSRSTPPAVVLDNAPIYRSVDWARSSGLSTPWELLP